MFRIASGLLQGAVLDPAGRTVAGFGNDGVVHLVDAANGRERVALFGHESTVLAAAFSADGRLIATAGADRTVRIWEVGSGRQLTAARVHDGNVNDVSFDPADSLTVLTASNDGTARRVRCTTCGSIETVLDLARHADKRTLTAGERRDLLG